MYFTPTLCYDKKKGKTSYAQQTLRDKIAKDYRQRYVYSFGIKKRYTKRGIFLYIHTARIQKGMVRTHCIV